MYDSSDLLKLIKTAASEAVSSTKPTKIVFGKVIKTNPLQIQIEQKLILSSQQLILLRNVTNYTLNIDVNINTNDSQLEINNTHQHSINLNTSTTENHNHTVTGNTEEISIQQDLTHNHKISGSKSININNALKVNEKVILLRVQGGQKYIVIDRVVSS